MLKQDFFFLDKYYFRAIVKNLNILRLGLKNVSKTQTQTNSIV